MYAPVNETMATARAPGSFHDVHLGQSPGSGLLRAVGGFVVVLGALKLLQDAVAEDFGDGEFPRWFREELRDEHVSRYGYYCPRCGSRVRRRDLTVDHIIPLARGGTNVASECRRSVSLL